MLLGMGVLGRFGKFGIDTVNGRLTLGCLERNRARAVAPQSWLVEWLVG
jgi:hypothetical protein